MNPVSAFLRSDDCDLVAVRDEVNSTPSKTRRSLPREDGVGGT